MSDNYGQYVITYTENGQKFEVIWHASTEPMALHMFKSSFSDKDFQKVSNVKIYSLFDSATIARLEADKTRLVEALTKIYRQDPYTTTDKAYFDFVYNTARDAVKEMEKSND